jgi:tRNA/tmRNA/rRNA uracil-C5-methylase (TrmA/RlmC/RlmD family)
VTDADTGGLCRVPGCVYDHLAYACEVHAKQAQLEGFLRRLPNGCEIAFQPPFASPSSLHYRNKIVLHTARLGRRVRLGYRKEPSHEVLDMAACPLACDAINEALARLRASDLFSQLPHGADVTFRHTPRDGACWWTGGSPAEVSSAMLTEDSVAGPLRVPRNGFYQVNPAVGDALVSRAVSWVAEEHGAQEILDLYCGVGVFGLACMKAGASRLCGVESGRAALAAAQANARDLGIPAQFHCCALGQEACDLPALLPRPESTTCIVDPPREGMSSDIVQALTARGPRRIIYVSCDPATLSRDLALLLRGGYRIAQAALFDMFPRTGHFESLVDVRRG